VVAINEERTTESPAARAMRKDIQHPPARMLPNSVPLTRERYPPPAARQSSLRLSAGTNAWRGKTRRISGGVTIGGHEHHQAPTRRTHPTR
jgi:hypothetical protein